MKTNTLSINIEYVGIKKNIQVLISEEHLRDVMGIEFGISLIVSAIVDISGPVFATLALFL